MRTFLVLIGLLLSPSALLAQGWIVPRPCADPCPPPPPCLPGRRCPPPRPCEMPCVPGDAAVERVVSHVAASLEDRVLSYEVEETFVNRGGRLGEADYLFPLPKGAAFQDLRLEIDGELVAGETLDADEARKIYEEIVRRQRDPALVEWMGHGLLRTRIFPINPGERKKVVVRFQMVAEREGGALRVDYFRGGRTGEAQQDVPRPRRGGEGRMTFTLTYRRADRFGAPYSPTHALAVEDLEDRAASRRVEVRGDAREVTILLPLRRTSEPAITVLAHAPGREDGFALITLAPPALARRATPRDVTFVLDVSGSMSGGKMEQARAAGKQLLRTLDERDRFRLIDFSTDVRAFRDDFVPATRANLAEAARYLDDLEPSGSTNIAGALDEALAGETAAGRLPLVLFLTDGAPTVGERNPAAIAARAARDRGRRRIFTFGLGADVNVALIEQLALEGNGAAHFVRPDEDVERVVALVASRLTSPVATDLRVRAEGVRLERMHPSGPIDLFAGQDLVLLARYEGSGPARIRFEGQSAAGPVSWAEEATFPTRERDNAFIPRLWATQRLGWLSAEKRKHGGNAELDREIRELGERYGIPTEFTSYFVREPGMDVVAQSGNARLRRIEGRGQGGATSGMAAPSAASPGSRDESFAAAKRAQEQRAATSLAAVDSMRVAAVETTGGAAVRQVGDRTFTLRDGAWVDARWRDGVRTVRVRAFSDAYFKLLERLPELRPALTLGDRVIVAGRAVAVEVGPDGAERLGERELASVEADW